MFRYQLALDKKINMPDAGHLQIKPWRQKEFSLLDPNNNLLTFGQCMIGNHNKRIISFFPRAHPVRLFDLYNLKEAEYF